MFRKYVERRKESTVIFGQENAELNYFALDENEDKEYK